jgi:hypothetical protein
MRTKFDSSSPAKVTPVVRWASSHLLDASEGKVG